MYQNPCKRRLEVICKILQWRWRFAGPFSYFLNYEEPWLSFIVWSFATLKPILRSPIFHRLPKFYNLTICQFLENNVFLWVKVQHDERSCLILGLSKILYNVFWPFILLFSKVRNVKVSYLISIIGNLNTWLWVGCFKTNRSCTFVE